MNRPSPNRSTVSKIIGFIKMNSSKEIHRLYGNTPVWQRGFYDHVIRSQHDYEVISRYITENPYKWQKDLFFR
ncbi:MAG: transposase [Clostridia bacterium]|nr:transposase [Clostridia bacterium]